MGRTWDLGLSTTESQSFLIPGENLSGDTLQILESRSQVSKAKKAAPDERKGFLATCNPVMRCINGVLTYNTAS